MPYKKGETYWIGLRHPKTGRKIYVNTKQPSREVAKAIEGDLRVKLAKEIHLGVKETKPITLARFAKEKYLPYVRANKTPATVRRYEVALNALQTAFRDAAGTVCLTDCYLSEVTPELVERYKAHRLRAARQARTLNVELTILKSLCHLAVTYGYLTSAPLQPVKFLKEPPERIRYLSQEERDALLAACREFPPLYGAVLLALHTGCRESELLAATWGDVDLKARILTVRTSKNGEPRVVPLNAVAVAYLHSLPRPLNPQASILPYWSECLRPAQVLQRAFRRACRHAGLTNLRFHDLRHDAASQLAMRGVNLKTIQTLLGHKHLTQTARYSHLSQAHLHEAVKLLETDPKQGFGYAQATAPQNVSLIP